MARELLPSPSIVQSFLEGHMTPIWFGSAINSFGVQELMEGIAQHAPPPQPRMATEPRQVSADEQRFPALSSRFRRIWIPSTGTAWLSCGCAPGTSSAA